MKIEQYVKEELKTAKMYPEYREGALQRAFGALFYECNRTGTYNKALAEWWENEMLPKFNALRS